MIGEDEKTLNGSTHNHNNPININKTRINIAPGWCPTAHAPHIAFFYPDIKSKQLLQKLSLITVLYLNTLGDRDL